jgi:hypothetical protein
MGLAAAFFRLVSDEMPRAELLLRCEAACRPAEAAVNSCTRWTGQGPTNSLTALASSEWVGPLCLPGAVQA